VLTVPKGKPLDLEIRGVGFQYPGQKEWVLRGVDLTLKAGQKLALCGDNGSGKSTLVKLILRLYTPTEGEIRYGGVDVRDLDAAYFRERISVVFQDYVRYQLTVTENVGLGDVARLEDRPAIERASIEAGAFGAPDPARGFRGGFIADLPSGFDTMLGGWFEKGHELSAGQWQKLAIARAFMRPSELLILDEPSASLDAEAEADLFARIRTLAAAQSAILISHRFSTIRLADQIAMLRSGRVEELGTHESLIAKGGRYAELFALQATGYR
jgi:ABC-type multidrug transport system fused ATPase/permease subunit